MRNEEVVSSASAEYVLLSFVFLANTILPLQTVDPGTFSTATFPIILILAT
jgi:hypothetical protein